MLKTGSVSGGFLPAESATWPGRRRIVRPNLPKGNEPCSLQGCVNSHLHIPQDPHIQYAIMLLMLVSFKWQLLHLHARRRTPCPVKSCPKQETTVPQESHACRNRWAAAEGFPFKPDASSSDVVVSVYVFLPLSLSLYISYIYIYKQIVT